MIKITKAKAKELFHDGFEIICVPAGVSVDDCHNKIVISKKYDFSFNSRAERIEHSLSMKLGFYIEPKVVRVTCGGRGYDVKDLESLSRFNKVPLKDKSLARYLNSHFMKPEFPGALLPSIRKQLIDY